VLHAGFDPAIARDLLSPTPALPQLFVPDTTPSDLLLEQSRLMPSMVRE
jgi:hypothetical protein